MVEGVGDVHLGQQRPGVLHDPRDVAALWKVCGAQYRKQTSGRVDAADQVDRGPAVLDEVVRVRLEPQPDASRSKIGRSSSIDRQN